MRLNRESEKNTLTAVRIEITTLMFLASRSTTWATWSEYEYRMWIIHIGLIKITNIVNCILIIKIAKTIHDTTCLIIKLMLHETICNDDF